MCVKIFYDYLKTAAGSMPLILLRANDAPPKEIKPIVPNIANSVKGEKEKIKPDCATPLLNPSNKDKPIKKPTTENNNACIRINRLIYLFPAPIAFKVP